MKFVIGLLIGALGVLALASVRDYSWQPPKRSNFTPAAVLSDSVNPVIENSPQVESSSPPIKSVTIEPLPADPAPKKLQQLTEEPLATEPFTTEPFTTEPFRKEPFTKDPATTAQLAAASVPLDPLPADPLLATNEQRLETAVVWKPFHSEVSADGFARRLSTQLGYPFRALREGPAKYHVVFDYGSEEQREMLRAQVKALTGFSLI